MKTKTLVVIGMTLGMFGAVHAQEGKKDGPKRKLPPEIIAKFDTDGDGKLDETERAAAKAAREEMMEAQKAKMLEKFDADGDGELSESEREAAKAAREAKMLEKFDADGDGELSKEEREKARAEMGPRGPRPGGKKGKKGGDE
ncbi:MAG: hypothetical protein ACSHX7_09285 [Luteolibacter sp.]